MRRSALRPALVLALLGVLAIAPSSGADDKKGSSLASLPGLKQASYQTLETSEGGGVRLTGDVLIEAGPVRVMADEVFYDDVAKTIEGNGNVVLSGPGMVLSGSHLFYYTVDDTGWVEDAVGYLEQDGAVLRADKIELLGKNRLRVENAVFTTCTQPTPYWSFRIRKGTFDLGQYAYLHGVSFRSFRVPVFYTPYLVWPIKEERASGLLFPEFGSSDNLGQSLRIPFYWAFAENADATFNIDFYTRVGFGIDTELRWLPTPTGEAEGRLRYINDQVRHKSRYAVEWSHKQELAHDFKLKAKIEHYSDFDFATDYETDFTKASTPQTVSTVDLSRDWSWYTLSLRSRRHQQYFVGRTGTTARLTGQVINDLLPEIELRARSRRLGKSPVYLSFETSASGFRKRIFGPPDSQEPVTSEDDLVTVESDTWARFDFAPKVRIPLLKAPWGDFQINAGWRGTWYSHHKDLAQDAGEKVVSGGLMRSLWSAGFTFSGPRFQRVFKTPNWEYSPKLKHVIEPFVTYNWRPESSIDDEEVIVFDEIDSALGRISSFRYGVRQRFFALRSPQTGRPSGVATAKEATFDALKEDTEQQEKKEQIEADLGDVERKLKVEDHLNPTEFASIEISQSYSTIEDLLNVYGIVEDLQPDGTRNGILGTRHFSPISVKVRFNPTHEQTVDIGYTFDPANKVLTETRISTLMGFSDRAFFEGSWYSRRSSNPSVTAKSNFFRSRWGMSVSSRFSFQIDWDYDIEASVLNHQFYQARYATQCCSFQLGYDTRDFVGNDRREFRLVVDLAGIGKLLDLKDSR